SSPPPQEAPGPLAPRQLERTFEVMAHSFVYWTRALHDAGVLAPGARILGLTNPMGDSVLRGTAAIAASKAALEIYARHLAFELGPFGYRVNLVKYGGVLSPAVEHTFAGPALERLPAVTTQVSPAGRMCTVEEVAGLVCFLASPAGGWFNGATIDFTGAEFMGLYDALIHPR
ncbi:MAG: SDR family oxidoreductase, partial [Myxococcota bacterium]